MSPGQGIATLERQQGRLLDAYLAEVIELAELERKRSELDDRLERLQVQRRQIEAVTEQQLELRHVAGSIEEFCAHVRTGLDQATFDERRALVELLIDCVLVVDGEVEIRYALPLGRAGPHRRFCHLRLDYRTGVSAAVRDATGGTLTIFEYVEIFPNRKRRHSALGYLSPVEFEERQRAQPLIAHAA